MSKLGIGMPRPLHHKHQKARLDASERASPLLFTGLSTGGVDNSVGHAFSDLD